LVRPGVLRGGLGAGVLGLAMGLMWGCREAATPTGPPRTGPDTMPPSLAYSPAQDTLVDSIGILDIAVAAHDQTQIDSVAVLIQGAPITFTVAHPSDTVFFGIYPVPLASLRHQPFSYRVHAADVLGHDTTTQSVNVRLR
jgi:hypothetical protein